jgi:hypothetical protein
MSTTKDLLVKNIKEWVRLDNEIKALKKEEKSRKTEKKTLNDTLIELMRTNEIDCVDIKDGQICYNQKTIKKPITKKNLLNILSKYYQGDIDKAEIVNDFILENREETIKETITRKINKE